MFFKWTRFKSERRASPLDLVITKRANPPSGILAVSSSDRQTIKSALPGGMVGGGLSIPKLLFSNASPLPCANSYDQSQLQPKRLYCSES
jgi:hypothetical protein